MNKTVSDIVRILQEHIREHLPKVSPEDLEEGGKVYYMNGKNGTLFDWFVNEHLSTFMVFYADRENLGAAKMTVYRDGDCMVYLFDDHGKKLAGQFPVSLAATEDELLKLAVLLRNHGDNREIWNADVTSVDTDGEPAPEEIQEFLDGRRDVEPSIRRKQIMSNFAFVSRRILDDGWKVGYMRREDPDREQDSGWQFYSGDEDDDYLENADNCVLCPVYAVANIDCAIVKYIDEPVGARLIRKSPEEFEDDHGQEIHKDKWK